MSDPFSKPSDPLDDALDSWLLAYEEWRSQVGDAGMLSPSAVPAHLRSEIFRIASCIEVLDRTLGGRGPGSVAANRWGDGEVESRRLGKFEIERELGRGGFSIVYLALDTVMHRQVALKVPQPDVLFSPDLCRRWLREAQSAASLDHPNIVRAFEAGQIGPICYIASAFCPGLTLHQWVRQQSREIPATLAAQLVMELAAAVEHAHQRGILHRDVKPGNVLVIENPDSGVNPSIIPMLTDFGLAKLLELDGTSEASQAGLVVGTPAYMSPEQMFGRTQAIGPATDVYGLGAVLYQMLMQRPPRFGSGESAAELMHHCPDIESPRTTRPDLPVALETIVMKCLAFEPAERYPTAQALHDDLQRFIKGQPVVAIANLSRRHISKTIPSQASTARWVGALLLCIVGGMVAGLWVNASHRAGQHAAALGRRTQEQPDTIEQQASSTADPFRQAALVRSIQQSLDSGQLGSAMSTLDTLRSVPDSDARNRFESRLLWSMLHREQKTSPVAIGYINAMAAAPDGAKIAFAGFGGGVRLWNVSTEQEDAALDAPHINHVQSLAFSPDGKWLAAAGRGLAGQAQASVVVVWNVATRQLLRQFECSVPVFCVAFSPHSDQLAVGGLDGITLWSLVPEQRMLATFSQHEGARSLAFSPNGEFIAAGMNGGGHVQLFRCANGQKTLVLDHGGQEPIPCVGFSPSSGLLASGGSDGVVRIWNVETGDSQALLRRHVHSVTCLAFINDALLASGDKDLSGADEPGELIFWKIPDGTILKAFRSHRREVNVLAMLNAHMAVTDSNAGAVKFWDLESPDPVYELPGHQAEVWAVAFAPNGKVMASASDDHSIKLWDLEQRRESHTLTGHESMVSGLAFAPDGKTIASASYDGTAKVWDLATRKPVCTLMGHTGPLRCIAYSPDGSCIATGGKDNSVRLWNASDGMPLKTIQGHTDHVRSVTFSTTGDKLISAGLDCTVRVYDRSQEQSAVLVSQEGPVLTLAVSPDGRLLAIGGSSGVVRIWDFKRETQAGMFSADSQPVMSLSFSSDSQTVACGSRNGAVRLWGIVAAQSLLSFSHPHSCNAVAFNANATALAAGYHDGVVRVWEASDK